MAIDSRVQCNQGVATDASWIKRNVDAFAQQPNGGLIVLPGNPAPEQRNLIVGLAVRHLLPAIYAYRPFMADGGLMSYHTDTLDL